MLGLLWVPRVVPRRSTLGTVAKVALEGGTGQRLLPARAAHTSIARFMNRNSRVRGRKIQPEHEPEIGSDRRRIDRYHHGEHVRTRG